MDKVLLRFLSWSFGKSFTWALEAMIAISFSSKNSDLVERFSLLRKFVEGKYFGVPWIAGGESLEMFEFSCEEVFNWIFECFQRSFTVFLRSCMSEDEFLWKILP